MMPIYLRKKRLTGSYGFSLLEMLVVMAIIGLVVSMVGARMVTSIEANRFVRTAEAAIADIKILRAQAMLDGRALEIINAGSDASDDAQIKNSQKQILSLPAGWISSGPSIHISSTGFCAGGQIVIAGPTGRKAAYDLVPPRCEPKRIAIPDQD